MNAIAIAPATSATSPLLELGEILEGLRPRPRLNLNLARLLSSRLLIQGSSGAGKSQTLRKLIEEAFEYLPTIIVDPEGEFGNLAEHIGAPTIKATQLTTEGLTAAGLRAKQHRLALHLDLSDLDADERISKGAAFLCGILACPREFWGNTVLVVVDEAHLLAPHRAGSAKDAETRRLGVATLTELVANGRKRGIAPVVATQTLTKLATSVRSELHNFLIGLNVVDQDIARAADLLGMNRDNADILRKLDPGCFMAQGPALSARAVLCRIDLPITQHIGATPDLAAPADVTREEAEQLLDLGGLVETGAAARPASGGMRGGHMLDTFLLDPVAAAAVRIIGALRPIAPNATTSADLARHLALTPADVDSALDLLGRLGAADTMPRADVRIVRLSSRLRLRGAEAPIVSLT